MVAPDLPVQRSASRSTGTCAADVRYFLELVERGVELQGLRRVIMSA
jgi:hypothetical protein